MITLEEFFMSRDVKYPPSQELYDNAIEIVNRANALLEYFGSERRVRSGYRPEPINALVPGASKTSKHITCQAIDLEDKDRQLSSYCLENLTLLQELGLWLEQPSSTPTWVHLQTCPPKSGKRVFIP